MFRRLSFECLDEGGLRTTRVQQIAEGLIMRDADTEAVFHRLYR